MGGGRPASPAGARHKRGRRVRLEVPSEEPYNVDGEVVRHGSADFRVERAAARMVVGGDGRLEPCPCTRRLSQHAHRMGSIQVSAYGTELASETGVPAASS